MVLFGQFRFSKSRTPSESATLHTLCTLRHLYYLDSLAPLTFWLLPLAASVHPT